MRIVRYAAAACIVGMIGITTFNWTHHQILDPINGLTTVSDQDMANFLDKDDVHWTPDNPSDLQTATVDLSDNDIHDLLSSVPDVELEQYSLLLPEQKPSVNWSLMKRFLLLVSFAFSFLIGVAQNGNRLEALKIAYITKRLDLSPEEAQKFWPIYNQYAEELKRARQDAIRSNKSEIELDESLLNIRKKYSVQFGQALSPQKIDTFFKSEKEFGAYVQKEMERRQLKNQRRLQEAP
jgi:hypothetical protein